MLDAILMGAVRRGSEKALGQLIDKYNAYVCAVIRNTVHLTNEDVEELSSDVFFALWENAAKVQKLKPWLGATARNKARNKLREIREDLPLADDSLSDAVGVEDTLLSGQERGAVKSAVLALHSPDREIFLRHYYAGQTVVALAAETGITEAAVKHRLVRGREKLRRKLEGEVLE